MMKQLIRQILHHFHIDFGDARMRRSINDFLTDRRIGLVLDVGANEGFFAQRLRERGYRGKIHSFEPIASVYRKLEDAARSDPNWDVYHFGLGAKSEQTQINVSDNTVFSSLLPTRDAAAGFNAESASSRAETIDVRTLDEVLPVPPPNTLLKVDTQGFERQVLDGARASLSGMSGVLLEVPIMQLYEGNWQFNEAIDYMDAVGFVPAQFHPVNFHHQDNASLVEVDVLFRRRDTELDGGCKAYA
jgi:FkbM family methyltransferase